MTGLDASQSVQFVSRKGKRFAVLSAEEWDSLIEWLESLEDTQIARQAFAELKAAKGNRAKAGWLKWDAVKDKPPYYSVSSVVGIDEARKFFK